MFVINRGREIMKKKDFNLYVALLSFIAGAAFILSNNSDMTANVIGASGESATLTAFIGLMIIIASSVFFILTINHGNPDIETMVRRDDNKHEDLNKEEKLKGEIEEKYGPMHSK